MQSPNTFKILKTMHLALLTGMSIFAMVAVVVIKDQPLINADESLQRILQVISVLLTLSSLLIGFNIFKRKILAARNSTEPGEKRMEQYRAACILWWALIEGPGLFATICYMLTGNYAFLALAILHMLILLAFMPRKENIILFLNLNSKEVAILEGK